MIKSGNTDNKQIIHENIVMPNLELPIRFHDLTHHSKGLYVILHWHSQIEIVYIKKGVIAVNCNSGMVRARAGEMIFINSNEPHSYYIISTPIELNCCTIDLTILKSRYLTSYEPDFIASFIIFKNHIDNDPVLIQHFLSMWDEGKRKETGYEYAIKSNLYSIIVLMLRKHIESTITNKQLIFKNRNLENINKIIQYIESHYKEDIALDDLAGFLNFNRYYFCRLFKEFTGMSPVKYINNYRVHQAISLMQNSDLTISEISSQVGFNNSNYFTKVFSEATNETPSSYLSRLKKS